LIDSIIAQIKAQPKAQRKDPDLEFDVLVTSYDLLVLDVEFLQRFRWRYAVFDEAHRLKNSDTRLHQTLRELYFFERRVGFSSNNLCLGNEYFSVIYCIWVDFVSNSFLTHGHEKLQVLMTGTPIQNNVRELWSLMNFCNPSIFSNAGR
jgi:SNF2 family DNA or RNA helicase